MKRSLFFTFVHLFHLCLLLGGQSLWAKEPAPFLNNLELHKPTFFTSSTFMNQEGSEQGWQNKEVAFQLSFKKQILGPLYFGYTQKAFWQLMNFEASRQFREQNFNPELFLQFDGQFGLKKARFALNEHQSNGRGQTYDAEGNEVNQSRTWNRTHILALWAAGDFSYGGKLWAVTDQKREKWGSFYEDNPDIRNYLGNGELYLDWQGDHRAVSLMLRRGTQPSTETLKLNARQAAAPMLGLEDSGVDFFLQVFSGYGDSLIDYNRKVERFAIGFAFR